MLALRVGPPATSQSAAAYFPLYPLLMRMTDQGLVEAEWREPAHPRPSARRAGSLAFSCKYHPGMKGVLVIRN